MVINVKVIHHIINKAWLGYMWTISPLVQIYRQVDHTDLLAGKPYIQGRHGEPGEKDLIFFFFYNTRRELNIQEKC